MLHKSVRLWQVCHTADMTKLFIQTIHCHPHFVKLVIIRAVRIGLFLMLKCRQIWIFSNIFWDSFLHQFSAQHINTEITDIGGRGQGINNTNSMKLLSTMYYRVYWFIWIYLTAVQICFLCNFGKQFFSKKKVLEKLMGSTDLQNLFWQFHIFLESEGSFQRLCFPPTLSSVAEWVSVFSNFFPALQDASYVLGTAEDQTFKMSSTVIWNMVIFFKFIICRKS